MEFRSCVKGFGWDLLCGEGGGCFGDITALWTEATTLHEGLRGAVGLGVDVETDLQLLIRYIKDEIQQFRLCVQS